MTLDAGVNLIILLMLCWGLVRVMNSKNPIEYWHFISTRNDQGKDVGDINSLGMVFLIVGGTWVVCWLAFREKLEWPIFGLWLVAIGAVKSWALWARALLDKRYGSEQQPLALPTLPAKTTTTTVTETPLPAVPIQVEKPVKKGGNK